MIRRCPGPVCWLFSLVSACAADADTAEVETVLRDYFGALTRVYESAADPAEVRPTDVWNAGHPFWKATSQEARIQSVDAAGFILIQKPGSYSLEKAARAGDYAKLLVRYATRGPVIRPGQPTRPMDTEYRFLRTPEGWRIVAWKNLEKAKPRPAPPRIVTAATSGGDGTAREHLENYLQLLSDVASQPKAAAQPKALTGKLGGFWVEQRSPLQTRSMSQSVTVFQLLQPAGWTLAPVSEAPEKAVWAVEYTGTRKGLGSMGKKRIEYTLTREPGTWKIQTRHDPDVPNPR